MPPFVPNTSGVKVPISTSNTLWLYFLFFSFSSCSLKIVAVCLPWLDRELTCVTRTSKNAVTTSRLHIQPRFSTCNSGLKVLYNNNNNLWKSLRYHIFGRGSFLLKVIKTHVPNSSLKQRLIIVFRRIRLPCLEKF